MQPTLMTSATKPPAKLPKWTVEQRQADDSEHPVTLKVVDGGKSEPMAPLNQREISLREQCEAVLERGLATCFEVGLALLTIHESRLYRETHTTFAQYCKDRWSIGRSYAWRVMGSAERLKLLPDDEKLPRPVSEFQMRPFLNLAPEKFPGAWRQAVKAAKEGKITTSVVQGVLQDLIPDRRKKKGKRAKAKAKLAVGQIRSKTAF
jgi:hypothetical protein